SAARDDAGRGAAAGDLRALQHTASCLQDPAFHRIPRLPSQDAVREDRQAEAGGGEGRPSCRQFRPRRRRMALETKEVVRMPIEYVRKGKLGYFTILNGSVIPMTPAMHKELCGHMLEFLADDGISVGIMQGAGDRAFSAGDDIKSPYAKFATPK